MSDEMVSDELKKSNPDPGPPVCLHCGRTSEDLEYHGIFVDHGLEIQLHKLLEQYFDLKVVEDPREEQFLCHECVNTLVDLYDLEEHSKNAQNNQNQDHEGSNSCQEQLSEEGGEEWQADSHDSPEEEVDEVLSLQEHSEESTKELSMEIAVEAEEYVDDFDIETYLNEAVNSDFESFQFEFASECKFCEEAFDTYEDLLSHIITTHRSDDDPDILCAIRNCQERFSSEKLIARHLIIRHCDIENLQVYGVCPYCSFRFTNFAHLNKHSCCCDLKKQPGQTNYCEECKIDFPSFKRFAFHVQFHMAKCRPKACLICEKLFNEVDDLFEHVQYRHENQPLIVCERCDWIFKTHENFEAHLKTHKEIFQFRCSLCPKQYAYKNLLLTHMRSCHKDTSTPLKCTTCDREFVSVFTYRNHLKTHRTEAESKALVCPNCGLIRRDEDDFRSHFNNSESACFQTRAVEETLTEIFICEYCFVPYKSLEHLRAHRSDIGHDDHSYTCPICNETFENLKNMRNHLRHSATHVTYEKWLNHWPGQSYFVCDLGDCKEKRTNWVDMHRHKRHPHKEQKCLNCNKSFLWTEAREEHMKTCRKPFECQTCGKQCPTKMSLSVHIARSHNNRNSTCPECSASFRDSQKLQSHMEAVHQTMQCSYCDKIVKNKRNLELHMRVVHSNEQRYFCSVCNKGYFQKYDRDAHQKNVHNEMVFKCNACPFQTAYAKSIEIHLSIHDNRLPFKCHLCSRAFARRNVLNMHIKRHQVDRQFVCCERILNGCNASFITNYLLNEHIRKKHVIGRSAELRTANVEEEEAELVDDPNVGEVC